MILDDLADLETLAHAASSSASVDIDDAALAEVKQRVDGARSLFASLGMAHVRPLQHLTVEERGAITEQAKKLRSTLDALAMASDAELVAYSSASADARGSLLVVLRGAAGLKDTLISAQRALLVRLANEIWPQDDVLRLDVIAHLSDQGATYDAARGGASVRARLLSVVEADRGLRVDELDDLIQTAKAAADACASIRDEAVPPKVLEFWADASSEGGASLADLDDEVRQWLIEHDALESFRVTRAE